MADFWNQRALTPPATCNIPYTAEEQREEAVIQSLQVVVEALDSFKGLSEAFKSLDAERYVMARLVYRSNNQHRNDKRLQMMKKIDQCLKRNAALKMMELVADLQQCFPGQGVCDFHPHFSNAVYIPSRQMYEHLLTKCVATAALLGRCASLCFDAFLLVRQMLGLGHFLANMSVLAANLSRIWLLCRHISKRINTLYTNLNGVISNLRPVATPWVPKHATFPKDLSHFLVQRADAEKAEHLMTEACVEDNAGEVKEEEDDDGTNSPSCDSISYPSSKENNPWSKTESQNGEEEEGAVKQKATEDEDIGLVVSRGQSEEDDVGISVCRDRNQNREDEDLGIPIQRGKHQKRSNKDQGRTIQRDKSKNRIDGIPVVKKRKNAEDQKSSKKKKVEHVHEKTPKKRRHESEHNADLANSNSINITPDAHLQNRPAKRKKKKKKKSNMS